MEIARLPREVRSIIFDEVQRYPAARELIKYLVADGRYDYLETGSLISLRMNVENIVAQELRVSGHKLYFYSRSDKKYSFSI